MTTLTFRDAHDRDLTELPNTCGSGYSGDATTRTNYEVLRRELSRYRGFATLYGDFSSYGIGVDEARLTPLGKAKLASLVHSLEDYPVLDEVAESKLEYTLLLDAFREDFDSECSRRQVKNRRKLRPIMRKLLFDGYSFVESGCIPYINWDHLFSEALR